MTMTIKQTIDLVRAVGMTCKWQSEYREYKINYSPNDARWSVDGAYFTDDSADAVATARRMAEWVKA